MLNMIIRKRRHRIITMIIIRLIAYLHTLYARLFRCLRKILGKELALFIEIVARSLPYISKLYKYDRGLGIGTYNVNKHIQWTLPLLNEFSGIMLLPLLLGFFVIAKVAFERFLAPGAINGVCDRRKCADGFVFAGVSEELPPNFSTVPIRYIYG